MSEKAKATTSPGRRRSTQKSGADNTRDKILDAAEVLFGERTFDTVSLRDITQKADVTLALASYHFGTKEKLFAEVVGRRADILCTMRRERLKALEDDGNLSTETILDAFMHPLFEQMIKGSEGWQSYLLILAQLGQSNRWIDLLHENFDETAALFLDQLRIQLPGVSEPVLIRGFSLSLVAMLQTLSKNRRVDAITSGTVSADQLDDAYPVLLTFVVKGLEGLSDLA